MRLAPSTHRDADGHCRRSPHLPADENANQDRRRRANSAHVIGWTASSPTWVQEAVPRTTTSLRHTIGARRGRRDEIEQGANSRYSESAGRRRDATAYDAGIQASKPSQEKGVAINDIEK